MKNIDLAIECTEVRGLPEGATVNKFEKNGVKITAITVSTPEAAKILGKPEGKYITAEIGDFAPDYEGLAGAAQTIADELSPLLGDGELLFCGLGNSSITPDALGPLAASGVIATRHLPHDIPELAGLRPVSSLAAGVLAQTGIETAEIVASLAARLRPAAVVTADALAARRLERLCKTVQISTTGISPGSGVGNRRARLDRETLGCEVISVGVPTVVDGLTLACGVLGIDENEREKAAQRLPDTENLMVTPQEIDRIVSAAAELVALAFNLAAQPGMDAPALLSLMRNH